MQTLVLHDFSAAKIEDFVIALSDDQYTLT